MNQLFAVDAFRDNSWRCVNIVMAPGGRAAIDYANSIRERFLFDSIPAECQRVRRIEREECEDLVRQMANVNSHVQFPDLVARLDERLAEADPTALHDPFRCVEDE